MTKVYVDTSVYGGVFDPEFSNPSKTFFNQVKKGEFELYTSAVVKEEISYAPVFVKDFFNELLTYCNIIEVDKNSLSLRDSYIKRKIVSEKYSNDVLHVALATISNCSLIISWNFKHIVHFEKISLYNKVNIEVGYQQISIFSPMEVINYE